MLMGGWPSFCKATESDGTPPSEGVKRLCVGRPLRPGSHVTEVTSWPITITKSIIDWETKMGQPMLYPERGNLHLLIPKKNVPAPCSHLTNSGTLQPKLHISMTKNTSRQSSLSWKKPSCPTSQYKRRSANPFLTPNCQRPLYFKMVFPIEMSRSTSPMTHSNMRSYSYTTTPLLPATSVNKEP